MINVENRLRSNNILTLNIKVNQKKKKIRTNITAIISKLQSLFDKLVSLELEKGNKNNVRYRERKQLLPKTTTYRCRERSLPFNNMDIHRLLVTLCVVSTLLICIFTSFVHTAALDLPTELQNRRLNTVGIRKNSSSLVFFEHIHVLYTF